MPMLNWLDHHSKLILIQIKRKFIHSNIQGKSEKKKNIKREHKFVVDFTGRKEDRENTTCIIGFG